MSVIRVGFVLSEMGWTGGVNYFKNLLSAIQILPEKRICPVVFVGFKSDTSAFEGVVEVVRTRMLDRYSFEWWISKVLKRVIKRDYMLYAVLSRNNVSLLSHSDRLWRGCKIPSIGWIPDFQHKHLPHFFSKKELASRDAAFGRLIKQASAILLSSQDALNDLNRYFSDCTTQTYVLRFVPNIAPAKQAITSVSIAERYKLDQKWFYLPNQFWAHKNHLVVIEALKLLRRKGVEVLVVATGNTADYRNRAHFPLLMKKVDEYGLQKNFLSLGVVPFDDVVSLMRNSIATINPSLFEGWSTTVEESKAMGKKIILSDISVHREQNPLRGFYFNPNSPEELANEIEKVLDLHSEFDDAKFQKEANDAHQKDVLGFAERYQEIVLEILGSTRTAN